MNTTQTTIDKLIKFVNQRPGLDFNDYGDYRIYRSELREITNDRKDFYELLGFASRRVDNLDEQLTILLKRNSDRLIINEKGVLEYCVGQYFQTEYRPAACRALRSLIWKSYQDEKDSTGNNIYKDGHEIRKAIRRNISRRVCKNYFN